MAGPITPSFTAADTALIVIDMQGDFCVKSEDTYLGRIGLSVANTREPIRPLQVVLAELRQRGFAIIHTREGHRPSLGDCPELKLWRSKMGGCELGTVGEGTSCCSRALVRGETSWDIIPELQPAAGEDVVDGCGKGKFVATDLEMLLRQRGVTTLVFGGVTTSCCVATTMREATDAGFDCYMLSDCTGDCGAYDYMDTIRLAGPRVLDAQTFLGRVDATFEWPLPPLGLVGSFGAFGVSSNILAAVTAGRTLDLASLRTKLAEDAHTCIATLKQRAATEAPQRDAHGSVCAVVACDGGRTNAWPHKPQSFTPTSTALLCIDIDFNIQAATSTPWMQQLRKLLAAAARAGVHIISAGPGECAPGESLTIRKPVDVGAFSGTSLEATLRARGVSNLLLAGKGAATGVNTTMRQASDRGFDTLVVADCVGCREEADLYGISEATIRKAIFSACAHSDALYPWLDAQGHVNPAANGKRPREEV